MSSYWSAVVTVLAWTKQNTMQRAMRTVLEWPQSHATSKHYTYYDNKWIWIWQVVQSVTGLNWPLPKLVCLGKPAKYLRLTFKQFYPRFSGKNHSNSSKRTSPYFYTDGFVAVYLFKIVATMVGPSSLVDRSAVLYIRNSREWAHWSQRTRTYHLHYDEVQGDILGPPHGT